MHARGDAFIDLCMGGSGVEQKAVCAKDVFKGRGTCVTRGCTHLCANMHILWNSSHSQFMGLKTHNNSKEQLAHPFTHCRIPDPFIARR